MAQFFDPLFLFYLSLGDFTQTQPPISDGSQVRIPNHDLLQRHTTTPNCATGASVWTDIRTHGIFPKSLPYSKWCSPQKMYLHFLGFWKERKRKSIAFRLDSSFSHRVNPLISPHYFQNLSQTHPLLSPSPSPSQSVALLLLFLPITFSIYKTHIRPCHFPNWPLALWPIWRRQNLTGINMKRSAS